MHTHKDGYKNRVTTLIYSFLTKTALGSTNILLRNNGHTRRGLPIAHAAPRPCSACLVVPLHTNRGSLDAFRMLTLLFIAFDEFDGIVIYFFRFVNVFFSIPEFRKTP